MMLRAIRCERGEASSPTGSKGKWSPEKAKDLFYLLNKKTIKREKEEEKKQERREKRGEDLRGDRGGDVSGQEVSLVTTATDNVETVRTERWFWN